VVLEKVRGPPAVGTEKQVNWGASLRKRAFDRLIRLRAGEEEAVVAFLNAEIQSKYWIDNKDSFRGTIEGIKTKHPEVKDRGGDARMTKADLVDKVHDELGFQKNVAGEMVEAVLALMKETLEGGENVKLSGFGSFLIKQKKDRRGRNPQTGETITIKARRILTFKPSTVLKGRLNA